MIEELLVPRSFSKLGQYEYVPSEGKGQRFESPRARHFSTLSLPNTAVFSVDGKAEAKRADSNTRRVRRLDASPPHKLDGTLGSALIARTRDPPSRANRRRPPGFLDLSTMVAIAPKGLQLARQRA